MATIAPYINNGVGAAPTLGWKSPALNTDVRVIAPIFGQLNAFIPNRKSGKWQTFRALAGFNRNMHPIPTKESSMRFVARSRL